MPNLTLLARSKIRDWGPEINKTIHATMITSASFSWWIKKKNCIEDEVRCAKTRPIYVAWSQRIQLSRHTIDIGHMAGSHSHNNQRPDQYAYDLLLSKICWFFLPVRRYANAGIGYGPGYGSASVRVCVCHTPVLCQNGLGRSGSFWHRDFFRPIGNSCMSKNKDTSLLDFYSDNFTVFQYKRGQN